MHSFVLHAMSAMSAMSGITVPFGSTVHGYGKDSFFVMMSHK